MKGQFEFFQASFFSNLTGDTGTPSKRKKKQNKGKIKKSKHQLIATSNDSIKKLQLQDSKNQWLCSNVYLCQYLLFLR